MGRTALFTCNVITVVILPTAKAALSHDCYFRITTTVITTIIIIIILVLSVGLEQMCELHVAGYEFAVLDNAFLLHPGFKSTKDLHATFREELHKNQALYEVFQQELKKKYPESPRICSKQK